MLLPRHVLGRLAEHPEIGRIHLVVSAGASQVLRHELGPERTGAADLAEAAGLSAGIVRMRHRCRHQRDGRPPLRSGHRYSR